MSNKPSRNRTVEESPVVIFTLSTGLQVAVSLLVQPGSMNLGVRVGYGCAPGSGRPTPAEEKESTALVQELLESLLGPTEVVGQSWGATEEQMTEYVRTGRKPKAS